MKQAGIYSEVEIDNRWIVPYNKFLCRAFIVHMNVELCMRVSKGSSTFSSMLIKVVTWQFLVYKVQAGIITIFQTGRCVSASELCWRILDSSLHV